jgi:hypothetical protein
MWPGNAADVTTLIPVIDQAAPALRYRACAWVPTTRGGAEARGIVVLRTNTDLSPLEAMLCYKQLSTVEQTFLPNSQAPAVHAADPPQARRDHPRSRVCSFLALELQKAPEDRLAASAASATCRRSSPT